MKRKLLATILSLCMIMGMLPVTAMAAEGEIPEHQEQTETTLPEEDSFDGIQPAPVQNDLPTPLSSASTLPGADSSGIITLTDGEYALPAGGNITADIVISSGNVTLDLNGGTLQNTNQGKATLTIQAGAAAMVKNGTILGGTGYYNIENFGVVTLEDLTATAGNANSSMICNHGTLTIQSGTYTGGMDTVKNEPNAELTIYDGTFTLTTAFGWQYNGVVLNYGNAVIWNGNFIQKATTPKNAYPQVIVSAMEADGPQAMTEIYGGTFKSTHSKGGVLHGLKKATSDNFNVTGGTYNIKPKAGFIADGYAVAEIGKSYVIGKAATEVVLNETELRLAIDETAMLTATVLPVDAISSAVTWKSSNTKVAKIDKNTGAITPKGVGETTITATAAAGGVIASCKLTVYMPEIAQVADIKYTSLEEAVAVAQGVETITIIRNIKSMAHINISTSAQINLNGHTLDVNGYNFSAFGEGTTLDIQNGTISGKKTYIVSCDQAATVNLTNITGSNTKNMTEKSGAAFLQLGTGNVNILNCEIKTSGSAIHLLGGQADDSTAMCTIADSLLTGIIPLACDENCLASVKVQSGGIEATTTSSIVPSVFSWPGMGTLTIEDGRFTGDMPSSEQGEVSITGGYFTSDPSAYVADGYIATTTDEPGYAYTVTKLDGETIADAPAQKEPEATVADGVPAEKVEATAKSVVLPDVTDIAAQETVSNTAKEEAAKQLQDKVTVTADETITVYKQVYLEVVATGYESKTEGGETITSLTMDITPMMQLVASTAATAEGIVLEETAGKAQNAIIYGDAKELHITTPAQITVTLPTEFANKDVYIKHEASSGTYFYTGKADENGDLTFTSEHGFSPFTFSTVNEAEAQIGSIGYPTFQAAVNAAKSGDTIQIIKHTEDGYKAAAEKTVTVENKTGSEIMVQFNEDTAAIAADDSHTFTYVTAVPVTGVTLDQSTLSLDLGSVASLTATITPDNATDKTAAWTSSDENIVTVKDGVVTAVGYGTAVVTVKVGAVEASCTVTVPYPYIPVVPTQPTQPTKPTQPDTPDEPDTPVVPAVNYADVAVNDWYYDEVAYVTAKGLMTGTTATTFAPNAATTRAMVWTILGRMSDAKVDGGEPWYALAQSWAMASGVSDGTNPNGSITREELAVMLYRYAGSPVVGVSELAKLGQFTDGEAVSDWAQEAMAWAVSNGVISGSGSAILPQQSATRAQVAAMLMRFCELNNK